MFGRGVARVEELRSVTSDLADRIQRLEQEHDHLRGRIEADRALTMLSASIVAAAHAAPMIGTAIEKFAQAMRARPARGRAGDVARARRASRYLDGTFMPESAKREYYFAEYERFAIGGRARAASARRARDGTFRSREF
jgi:hypothetical protein